MKTKTFLTWMIAGLMTSLSCLAQGKFELKEYTGDEKASDINVINNGEDKYIGTLQISTGKMEITCTNQSILKLYCLAYDGISDKNFLFSDELAYIDTGTPKKRYSLSFSGTHAQLIHQLDSVLQLKTEVIKVDSAALEVKKIKGGNNIRLINNAQTENKVITTNKDESVMKSKDGSKILATNKKIEVKGQLSMKEFATLITNEFGYPVTFNESIARNIYDINLTIDGSKPVDELIVFFENEGITFKKKKNQIEYVQITK
jgi:hypothetical protein